MKNRKPTVFQDPIVEEVREIKRRLAEMFDYDVRAMLKHVQKRESRGGRKIVTLPAK